MKSPWKLMDGFEDLPRVMPDTFLDFSPEILAICRCVCKTWNRDISSLLIIRSDGIDRHAEAHIQFLRKKLPRQVVEGSAHKEYEKNLRLRGLEPGQRYIHGTSLLEIFSICVHPSDGASCRVYGEISVRDELGNIMTLYDRSEDQAELVSNGVLSLDMYICPAKALTISFNLNDEIQGGNIAKGELALIYSKEEDFDEKLCCQEVYGDYGYASISYRSFRSAVVAEVSVVCDLDVGKRAVYGIIRTRLGDLYRKYCHFNDPTDDHILVHKKQDVPLSLSNIGIIELSKSMVVVPACSSLRVGVRLNACEDTSLIVCGSLVFDAKDDEHVRRELSGVNDECVVAVEVKWSLGDHIFPRMKVINKEILGKHDMGVIEIFSFSIGCVDEKSCLGKIQLCSSLDNFNIYERYGNYPRAPCVSWPKRHVLAVGDLRIKVNFEDPGGRQVCKGYVLPSEFASRRICSVVRGEYGCVALHYAIIKDPKVATVIVKFFPDDTYRSLNVYGSITTTYGDGDSEYKTYYDKTYYQSVLFKRSILDPVTLSYGEEIPLVKCIVATPKNCPLVVKFDLQTLDRGLYMFSKLFLQNRETFKASKCGPEKIVGQGFYVTVEVSWE